MCLLSRKWIELAPHTHGTVKEMFWVVPEHLLISNLSNTHTHTHGVSQMILSKSGPLAVTSVTHRSDTYLPKQLSAPGRIHTPTFTYTHTGLCGLADRCEVSLVKVVMTLGGFLYSSARKGSQAKGTNRR